MGLGQLDHDLGSGRDLNGAAADTNLERALAWLDELVRHRAQRRAACELLPPPDFRAADDPFTQLLCEREPAYAELVVLLLALAPHLAPGRLDAAIGSALSEGAALPEAGGVRGSNHRGLLPTGETALWLLAGSELEARAHVARLFRADHWFAGESVLELEPVRDGEPLLSGRLLLDAELVELLQHGCVSAPRFGATFPAQRITTRLDWDDLVLQPQTRAQIRDIENWLEFSARAMGEWGLGRRIKPGYRALFHGPPGTGKTLTATLLGRAGTARGSRARREVFRIDLSRVVSKYIGETEQNLARLFDRAESKDWILFFDEADALFGRRTEVRDAHDKYANQQAAYLLQRIEDYDGLVILATNQRNGIDEAFVRRFQAVIHFPLPRAEERQRLWEGSLPARVELAADLDLGDVSARYEISGASILNVVQHCAIGMLADATVTLDRARLESAIHREFVKEGKVV